MSDAETERRFRQKPRIAWREIDGEAVLVDPVRGRMLVLNDTGLYLWQALELPKNTGELADSLCAEFAVSAETATRDVNVFLESLRERNLLEAAE